MPEIKKLMEQLLNNKKIVVELDEQIVFDQINKKKNAIWSLLLASGYLKVISLEKKIAGKSQMYGSGRNIRI